MNTVTFDTGTFTIVVIALVVVVCCLLWAAFQMGMEKADYEHYRQNGGPSLPTKTYFDSRTGTWMEYPRDDT